MPTLHINLEKKTTTYPIHIGRENFSTLRDLLPAGQRVYLVTDQHVDALYGEKIRTLLDQMDIPVRTYRIPPGEENKTLHHITTMWTELLENHYERDDSILALGGGIVGDMAGFVASTYLRGISFIQIPTTLLAQVDSSIGGKTGINYAQTKNMIGAFHQPSAVISNLDTLTTLPERQWVTGYAECLKHGLIADATYWEHFAGRQQATLSSSDQEQLVDTSCRIKANIVMQDEQERTGARRMLNFGHTIGHAIESVTNFARYTHGEAISLGMVGEAWLSTYLGMLSESDVQTIITGLKNAGLPTTMPALDTDALIAAMHHDKKASQGNIRWVLLEKIGKATTGTIIKDNHLIQRAVEQLWG